VVIDIGINKLDGKIVGDADFDSCYQVAGKITPVPGGVGPVVVSSLLYNTYKAFIKNTMREEDIKSFLYI